MNEHTPVADWTTDYDIGDQAYVDDPVPIWREMRERCPVAHTERYGGSWNPTRFDDVRALAKMVPELSSRQMLVFPPPPGMPELSVYEQQIAAAPISADPPIQTWTRRMILSGVRAEGGGGELLRLHRGALSHADRRVHRDGGMRRRRRLCPTDPAAGDRPHVGCRPGDVGDVHRLGERSAR
ncbi:MAG: hypothetical protein R2695_03915 [Acidimicrobiales bacterium]